MVVLIISLMVILAMLISYHFKITHIHSSEINSLQTRLESSKALSNTLVRRIDDLTGHNTKLASDLRDVQSTYEQKLVIWQRQAEKEIRADAVARSRVVNHGFSVENFAPILSDMHHKDFRHLGDPIDYLVFDGSDAVRNKTETEIGRILLLDIKTGNAKLNTIQRRIRDAVVEGRVYFAVYNPDTQTFKTWPEEDGTDNDVA